MADYKEISGDNDEYGVEGEGNYDEEIYWRSEKKEKSYLDLLRFRKEEVLIDGKLKSTRQ